MDRAAIGLGAVFLRLRAELNWHRIFHELIDEFEVNGLGERQSAALTAQGLDPTLDSTLALRFGADRRQPISSLLMSRFDDRDFSGYDGDS